VQQTGAFFVLAILASATRADDLEAARETAVQSGKPLTIVFR
jgi:hypothetical protein